MALFALAASLAIAAQTSVPPAIVSALMRDRDVAQCLQDSETASSRAYVAQGFRVKTLALHDGVHVTVLIGNAACFTLGAAARVFIFERSPDGSYRRVLDSLSLPDLVQVSADGTAHLVAHETMDVFVESTYLWNGKTYVFSPTRSTVYDVASQLRVPYETPVLFAPGSHRATLTGAAAPNLGRRYVFRARKGQKIAVRTIASAGGAAKVSIWIDDTEVGEAPNGHWSGTAPRTGEYALNVYGARYELLLTVE